MERILRETLTHRSRFPKGVTKLPLAAEGVTLQRQWLVRAAVKPATSQSRHHVCASRQQNFRAT